MSKRRVVVTGLGIVSPVGSVVVRAWDNIVAGRSGIRRIEAFDANKFSVQISGSVRDFNADDYILPKEQKKMDTFLHYGIAAGMQAMQDSGVTVTEANATRIGVAIGSGIGGLPGIEKNYEAYMKGGPRRISPFFVPSSIINMTSGHLSIMYGMCGPNISIVSACTTGTHNIGDAARMIAYSDADIMLAGGAEMATCPLGIGGFASARALCASHNDDPEHASRPWDLHRDGFVLGDGAGVLVLEEYEHAKARGANIYCEFVGYGVS
ncbi:MAG TPA: beta-ketoacyl-ACP synthase II, partial [Gammaproteobacteria bacterium]|nr:beta-ketoacyl-ACP synthase II [Gammaproteobacteria bacterium]